MKRTLSSISAFVLFFALTGCQSYEPAPDTTETTPTSIATEKIAVTETTVEPTAAPLDPTIHVTSANQNQRTYCETDPYQLLKLYRLGGWDYNGIYCPDGVGSETWAYIDQDGSLYYVFGTKNPNGDSPKPWWELQEIPEGMTLQLEEYQTKPDLYGDVYLWKFAHTNFYVDLPQEQLSDSWQDHLVTLRHTASGTYVHLSSEYALEDDTDSAVCAVVYLYKNGSRVGSWTMSCDQDTAFLAAFCNWFYDGRKILNLKGTNEPPETVFNNVPDARLGADPFVDALVIEDGVLNLYDIDPYLVDGLQSGFVARNVLDARFGCGTIIYTGSDGLTYALYTANYYDVLRAPEEGVASICLGAESLDHFQALWEEYLQNSEFDTVCQAAQAFLDSYAQLPAET